MARPRLKRSGPLLLSPSCHDRPAREGAARRLGEATYHLARTEATRGDSAASVTYARSPPEAQRAPLSPGTPMSRSAESARSPALSLSSRCTVTTVQRTCSPDAALGYASLAALSTHYFSASEMHARDVREIRARSTLPMAIRALGVPSHAPVRTCPSGHK